MICKVCGGETFIALDLGLQPLANDFAGRHGRYPLQVAACRVCGHGQLTTQIDPHILFRDYPYVTGTSETLRQYCENFAEQVTRENDPGGSLLEIACNDGTQLRALRARGWNVFGYEPAKNLADLQGDLPVTREFFGADAAHHSGMAFNVVIAQNVLAHVPDPRVFLLGVYMALKPGGVAYIQTSQSRWIDNAEFDCVYHEHSSYFNPQSLAYACRSAGLTVVRMDASDIHGGSLIAICRKNVPAPYPPEVKRSEFAKGWETLQDRAETKARYLRAVDRPGLLALGAAAKGTVLLNYTGMRPLCVYDEAPQKIGLTMPGTGIPIRGFDVAKGLAPNRTFLILAWNFAAEIKRKIKFLRPDACDQFIIPFPYLRTES